MGPFFSKLEHGHDVVAVAFRPDGQELVASTLDGHLSFWDVKTFRPAGTIEGRRDVSGGRLSSDRITAKHSAAGKCFSSICYTADGSCLLAGGSSKFVCIYELGQKVLLKQFCISSNLSLDGTQFFLNSKNMTAVRDRVHLSMSWLSWLLPPHASIRPRRH